MEAFKKKIKIILNNLKNKIKSIPKPFIGVLIAILILVLPLLGNKITYGHDYLFHATNNILSNTHIDILKLKFTLPKIFGSTIANGFGYGTGIFYPPLSYYLTSYITYFLNLTNENSVLSLTYLQILIILSSGIIMYKFVKRISKDDYVSAISSITYISYSYFLCNVYTRNAYGECLISLFLPIVFWGLYELFFGEEKKFIPLFTIGYVGMINSQLVLSIYITIIIILLFIFNIKKVLNKNILSKLIISSIIILLMSSSYLIPLIEHSMFSNYIAFEPNSMYTNDSLKEMALSITDFFMVRYKTWNGVEVYISFITLLCTTITIINNKKIFKKENRNIYMITILIVLISGIMSSKLFPWAHVPYFMKIIQFPWRLCGVTSFGISILSGYMIKIVERKYKKIIACLISTILILFGYATISQENIMDITLPNEMYMGFHNEYLPVNTKNNEYYYNNRNQNIEIKEGNAKINILENNTPYLKSEINLNSDSIVIELPRLYYLGYEIKLKDNNGKIEKINYYENEYGFIELEVNKNGILEIEYKGTTANKIANKISLITIIISLTILIYKRKNNIYNKESN